MLNRVTKQERINFPSRQRDTQLVFQLCCYVAALLAELLTVIASLYILALCGNGGDIGGLETQFSVWMVYMLFCIYPVNFRALSLKMKIF